MFHVHIGYRSRDGGTSCEAARQYIVREGKYRKRGDVVRMVAPIHMPAWAGDRSANAYWAAAEGNHSRANGRTALILEFALPSQPFEVRPKRFGTGDGRGGISNGTGIRAGGASAAPHVRDSRGLRAESARSYVDQHLDQRQDGSAEGALVQALST